jgi:hypothetical protein
MQTRFIEKLTHMIAGTFRATRKAVNHGMRQTIYKGGNRAYVLNCKPRGSFVIVTLHRCCGSDRAIFKGEVCLNTLHAASPSRVASRFFKSISAVVEGK